MDSSTPSMPKNAREAENLYYYYLHQESQEVLYKEILPIWFRNFRDNLPYIKKSKYDLINGWEKKSDNVIVFCAGPSHKKVNIQTLKKFDGDIIGTNKTLKFLYKHGIKPACILGLDAAEVMIKSFKFHHSDEAIRGQKFYFATVLSPTAVKYVLKHGGDIYWGNPEIPNFDNGQEIMEIMAPVGLIRHGGNVGSMGVWLSYLLKYKNIGVVGMDMGVTPSRKWSPAEAGMYKYYWIPWRNKMMALNAVFMAYLGEFSMMVRDISSKKEGYMAYVQNLTPGSMLELINAWPTRTLEDFVANPDIEYTYFEHI